MSIRPFRWLLGAGLFLSSCHSAHVPTGMVFKDYRVTDSLGRDTVLSAMLAPYRDSVNRSMNDIVGYLDAPLEKKSPQGSLGDFMADAMFQMAKVKFGIQPDVAVVNSGGIRLTQIPAGPVTRGRIFELMPFDNLVVVQRVKGDVLQQFLDLAASGGGWPLAGVSMGISNKKAVDVRIGGQPLDPGKTYLLVNSDYVAGGGDNAAMLKSIPQENVGYLMRDALLDYIRSQQAAGHHISIPTEKRVYAQ
jgi:2',3'-cyclic-nucleotide 2'-phosphodiesterase (5'-nucleotidase family)